MKMGINVTKGPWKVDTDHDIVTTTSKLVVFATAFGEGGAIVEVSNPNDLQAILNVPTMVRFIEDVAEMNGAGTIIGYEARRILNKIEGTEL